MQGGLKSSAVHVISKSRMMTRQSEHCLLHKETLMKTHVSALVLTASLALAAVAAAGDSAGAGLKEAQTPTELSFPAPAVCNTVRFRLKAGAQRPGPKIVLTWNDGKDAVIKAEAMSTNAKEKEKQGATTVAKDVILDDQYVAFGNIKDYVRPNLQRYTDAQQKELYGKWVELPRASEHLVAVEFRWSGKGWEFWLEGCYGGLFERQAPLKSVKLQLPAGSGASDPVFTKSEDLGRYLPLDMAHIARASSMTDAAVSLADGRNSLKGIPIRTLETGESGDVGRVKMCRGNENMEEDQDLSRTGLDNMPEHLHYSVPLAQYIRAWVLCAAEEDAKKDPVLTARLTRFGRWGRGEAIADTTITLPRSNETPAAGITNVGTVRYSAGGNKVTVPLWLCEVTLKVGEIQDLLWGDRTGPMPLNGEYLDFEFLGKLDTPYLLTHRPDPKSVSAVHVFGVTLERSPVEMEVRKMQVANMFDNDEKPETQVALRPASAAGCCLKWEIRDLDGKTLDSKTENVTFAAGEPERLVPVSLAMKDLGWYAADFTLTGQDGRELVRHPASFVLLGPDTRKAGFESPYMAWWVGAAHEGTADPKIGAAMLMKIGVRRTCFDDNWHGKDACEKKYEPWKLTLAQINWMGQYYRLKPGQPGYPGSDWVQGPKGQDVEVRRELEKWPHCRAALLFHEGWYEGPIAPELRDAAPTEKDLELTDIQKRFIKLADAVSGVYREKFPQLRVQLGNSSSSSPSLIAMLLRNKFPRDRFDCLGSETVGFGVPPESSVMRDSWIEQETARKFGFEVPMSACFEFTCRVWRTLGARRQAEFRIRDMLLCHGFGYIDVAAGGLYDAGDAYEHCYYGACGTCERYPLLYPRPEIAAVATLTRVLDQVKLRRRVPTGSHSIFALEFERGKETVYALWTPNGVAQTALSFDADGALTLIDMYGRSRQVSTSGRKVELAVGSAAIYLVGNLPNAKISVVKRTFPDDQPPANLQVANHMDNPAEWEMKLGAEGRVQRPTAKDWPLLTNGAFDLRQVDDPEKGSCLELNLKPEGKLPDIVQEYAYLKLRHPQLLAGAPSTFGVWVNGNSSWGRVMFEFEDAKGQQWLSAIQPPDPHDEFVLDFDGWRFMSYPITDKSSLNQSSPKMFSFTSERQYWMTWGHQTVQYPIKLTGLMVYYGRKGINLKEMEPVRPTIRLKDLGTWE